MTREMVEVQKARIEAHAESLMSDFFEHFRQSKELDPDVSQTRVFEAWLIQRIAAMEVVFFETFGEGKK